MSCAERTNTPVGTLVVKAGGFSASGGTGVAGVGAAAVSPAAGAAVAPGTASTGFFANSSSNDSAVILSIVLETVLTG